MKKLMMVMVIIMMLFSTTAFAGPVDWLCGKMGYVSKTELVRLETKIVEQKQTIDILYKIIDNMSIVCLGLILGGIIIGGGMYLLRKKKEGEMEIKNIK